MSRQDAPVLTHLGVDLVFDVTCDFLTGKSTARGTRSYLVWVKASRRPSGERPAGACFGMSALSASFHSGVLVRPRAAHSRATIKVAATCLHPWNIGHEHAPQRVTRVSSGPAVIWGPDLLSRPSSPGSMITVYAEGRPPSTVASMVRPLDERTLVTWPFWAYSLPRESAPGSKAPKKSASGTRASHSGAIPE